MEIEKKLVQGDSVFLRKTFRGKGLQTLFVVFTCLIGFLHIQRNLSKRGRTAGDSLFFGVGKSVVKCKGISADFRAENILGKFFEAGILRKAPVKENSQKDACDKDEK